MKIEELINKINKRRTVKAEYRKYYDGSYYDGSFCNITISTKDLNPCNQWFFSFGTDCYSWAGVAKNYDWLTNSVSADDLAYVVVAINEFMDTPIKERFPEKKYCLEAVRHYSGPIAEKGYVKNVVCKSDYSGFEYSPVPFEFTEKELETMKKNDPVLAPAIDAMKEPVEDKDE